MDVNSVDSWKGPHTETGRAVARRRSGPCHRLSSLARPPSLSGGGGRGLLYHFSGCPRAPCLSLPMSHSSSFLRRRAWPCPPHWLSPGARLFPWQWASFKAHGQQHPQCSLARSLRTGARSPTYTESRCWGQRSVGDIAAAELAPSLVGVRGDVWAQVKEKAGSCVQPIVRSAVPRDPIW